MKCVSYTRTLPWKNHQGELAIAEQNQRIAAYLAEHKELDLLKKYSDRKNDEKARTAFDQMTDDGVERKFDCIIVASMYYCGSDFPAARQAIKETLYATGIDLIVLDEGLDTRTASRKEVEDYFEAKRCEMHAEIMFAWRRKQGAGFRLTSSVPFGYIRRNGESNMIKDEEVAPYLSEAFSRYALELEHLEEEKLAAAIQQGAGRKVIEAVRAEKSVQMKSVLAELNMEQFRRVPLYESYMADEITKEQYCAELLDYEEAHRKLNEQLTAIMEDTLVWERALSLRNPWIQQMAQYKTPEFCEKVYRAGHGYITGRWTGRNQPDHENG